MVPGVLPGFGRKVDRMAKLYAEYALEPTISHTFAPRVVTLGGVVLPPRFGFAIDLGESGEHLASSAVVVVDAVDDTAGLRVQGECREDGGDRIVLMDQVRRRDPVAREGAAGIAFVETSEFSARAVEAGQAKDHPGGAPLHAVHSYA